MPGVVLGTLNEMVNMMDKSLHSPAEENGPFSSENEREQRMGGARGRHLDGTWSQGPCFTPRCCLHLWDLLDAAGKLAG